MVEVMMALAILTIAASGIVAMQKATLVGNMKSRNLATASQVAQAWMSRLRADSVTWTTENGTSKTKWLINVEGKQGGTWRRPDVDQGFSASPEADVRGNDVFDGKGVGYCTNFRLTKLSDDLIRAEVRVHWLRHHGSGGKDGNSLCGDNEAFLQEMGAYQDRYGFVYATSTVIRNG